MELKDFQVELDKLKTSILSETQEKAKAEMAEQVKSIETQMDAQKEEIKALKAKGGKIAGAIENKKSFEEKVFDTLEANKEVLGAMASGNKSEPLKLNLKAAATMTLANYSGGTVGLSQWDSAFALVARREPFIRQLMNNFTVSSKYVAWAEQANRDGGAGNTAEGAAKTQADFDLVEASKQVEKITAYTKVSKEMLADIGFIAGQINNDLLSLVNLKLDTDLFGGNGTTPVLKGVNTYATTFSVSSTVLAGGTGVGIQDANEFDVLRAAIWQIQNAYFQPNYILLNPIDAAKIDMLKSTTNEYLVNQAAGQFMFKSFYGIPIVTSNVVTAGNFLVGDFTKSNLGIREDVNIQIGLDGSDFTNNLLTVLAEVRAVHYIKSNHQAAFVKGTFSTAKAAMLKT